VAISYVRLLLNDTTLRDHQYRMGLADTKICESNVGIEDLYHFFFQCSRHSDIRTKLKQEIQRIWTDSGRNGSPRWSVALLLAPTSEIAFTKAQSRKFLLQRLNLLGSQDVIYNHSVDSNVYWKQKVRCSCWLYSVDLKLLTSLLMTKVCWLREWWYSAHAGHIRSTNQPNYVQNCHHFTVS